MNALDTTVSQYNCAVASAFTRERRHLIAFTQCLMFRRPTAKQNCSRRNVYQL